MARLARQIPYVHAMQIMLTGDPVPAPAALAMGLLNEIVPRESLLERAFELAARISTNGPLAVRKIKAAAIRCQGLPLEDAFTIEDECVREVMRAADAREGPRAFVEKRTATFTGR